MQVSRSRQLICVSSGASMPFLRSGKYSSLSLHCVSANGNAASELRRKRGTFVSFATKYRSETYYVEKWGGRKEEEEEEEEEVEEAWKGAIIVKRSVGHMEYSTTLERVGLSNLSSHVSKSTAESMGLAMATRVSTDYSPPTGTPLLVSLDTTRKKTGDLLLHGLIRTFISLPCNRCAEQAAHRVFSNFCLLLHEKPLKEPDQMTKVNSGDLDNDEDEEEELDQMYFPLEEKEIDISKYIRDIVHLEVTVDSVCDHNCKGLCLKCGTNFNKSTCKCRAQKKAILYEPSQILKKQMQQR
ncbi:hypothetical protein SUGI_0510270 [Cryptomeria japonica]|uniref:large ribosomal RNA subunit accumulation protein YCED homolog 1, chloroplastic n=1 Tax=Cryptomeria japonica TaxID=3369 RepID=UPI002408CA92|nr:large ribosomal RNA subunit accumulation protein YCED homolog 1, chloroplastic [Cryptomeria japonica]GLJ26443.1 hypothetical protein SUGI_0510270 [Cryptomeria japonica]